MIVASDLINTINNKNKALNKVMIGYELLSSILGFSETNAIAKIIKNIIIKNERMIIYGTKKAPH
ncbi:hypothetical protein A3K93_10290 [Acinetobacter sp. NCu2D-2]|uniref:hypothetical protein n=1 Tax=Acinetobacter sp. NCu2D-2 TaxID=1608473 RepID=UPI0007CDA9AC|nr:hypothetical protein [Acinetobacter sp. NCu2D-2]ANF82540.1 hypothetical protein A3K93_10290 [Acinetobacter sp. NCu2D-2]